jgi:FkbM family methyltransferase
MDFSNPVMRTVRRARATGLAKPAARLISRSDSYEARFNASLTSSIRPGDRVWDIGANVGHYTAIFSSLAGPSGRVYAFEPTPSNFARLKLATGSLANVTAFQLALSDRQSTASFMQGTDDLGATSRVLAGRSGKLDGTGAIDIELTTGDSLLAERLVEAPSVTRSTSKATSWKSSADLRINLPRRISGAFSLRCISACSMPQTAPMCPAKSFACCPTRAIRSIGSIRHTRGANKATA